MIFGMTSELLSQSICFSPLSKDVSRYLETVSSLKVIRTVTTKTGSLRLKCKWYSILRWTWRKANLPNAEPRRIFIFKLARFLQI